MTRRLRARLLCTLISVAGFAILPLSAQTPTSAAPAPTNSGRPATSGVTLKFDTAFTGDAPFEARGVSAGSFSVAQFGAEVAVPLPPVGGNLYPIPVATFNWTPAPDWRVTLGFPRTGVIYTFTSELDFEFTAEADFGSFYVTDDPLAGGGNKPALNRTRLEYQSVRVGPAIAWRVSPTVSARASVGAVPVLNADYDQRNYRVKSERTAPYASAALEWKF